MIEFEHYVEPRYSINGHGFIIGSSQNMITLFHYINTLANKPTTVLIKGETGTGKELVAKALHYNREGDGRNGHFVPVNCAGIPEGLLETILFGYAKGAFTGASVDKKGSFEHAEGGTIFLDEIAEMSPYLQAKILRVIQEREITPIGSNDVRKVNVRVIAATNRMLKDEIAKGNFRKDLYYRLNVFPIEIPPLRGRRSDIPLIADYLVEKYNTIYSANIKGFSEEAVNILWSYDWDGNVRELENIIENVFVRKSEGKIEAQDILIDTYTANSDFLGYGSLGQYIRSVLKSTGKSSVWLAAQVGVERNSVYPWFSDKNFPSPPELFKLIRVLNLDLPTVEKLILSKDKLRKRKTLS